MNIRSPQNAGNFLTSCKPVSSSRRTQHNGVSVCIYIYIRIMQVYKCTCDDVNNGALTLILFETDNTEVDKRT